MEAARQCENHMKTLSPAEKWKRKGGKSPMEEIKVMNVTENISVSSGEVPAGKELRFVWFVFTLKLRFYKSKSEWRQDNTHVLCRR